jgi:hypothetical protein
MIVSLYFIIVIIEEEEEEEEAQPQPQQRALSTVFSTHAFYRPINKK